MKSIPVSFRRGPLSALSAALFLLASAVSANAQTVYLTFSGGGGIAPVTISWSSPITYAINFTSPNSGVAPYFVFQSIPNGQAAFPIAGNVAAVAPTYIGSGTGSNDGLQTINQLYGVTLANAQNAVFFNDVVFWGTTDNAPTIITAGDEITLGAGALVYNSGGIYSGTLPTSGYYSTIIVDAAYVNLGTGSAIPEPSTYAACAGVAMLGFVVWRRRKAGAVKPAA